jgi:pimeloyl-ACP methyl ester carboxylesterase
VGQRIAALIGEKRRGKTVLAGYSAGGVIAMIAALRSGPGVSGLLLSNTGLNTQSHGDPQAPQKIRSGLSDAEASAFIDSCFYYPVPQPLKQKMLAYIKNAPPEAGYQAALSLRETDLREEAAGITCPVIIAHGIYDKRRLKEHALEMNRVIKHSRIIWLEGGHTIMVDDGEGYAKALTVLAACSG